MTYLIIFIYLLYNQHNIFLSDCQEINKTDDFIKKLTAGLQVNNNENKNFHKNQYSTIIYSLTTINFKTKCKPKCIPKCKTKHLNTILAKKEDHTYLIFFSLLVFVLILIELTCLFWIYDILKSCFKTSKKKS